jgi:hypothetical protein
MKIFTEDEKIKIRHFWTDFLVKGAYIKPEVLRNPVLLKELDDFYLSVNGSAVCKTCGNIYYSKLKVLILELQKQERNKKIK